MAWKLLIHNLSFIIRKSRGFTLVELIVVMSMVAILLGLITINLLRSQQTASLTAAEQVLLADLKQQQIKSMIGDTEGRASSDQYGIHFDSDKYVLFHGTYSSGETSNSVINLESNMQFNSAGFDVVFERVTGEIPAPVIIELQDNPSSRKKIIHLNQYGIVTEVESL